MGKLERSWELVKASWAVLRADKELIIFPMMSMIAVTIVMATFAVPLFLSGILEGAFVRGGGIGILGVLVGFAFYTVQYTVIFYCNSALVGAAMIRLDGGDPTISDGFAIANKRIGSILGYALLAATVGVILRNIARRGMIGRIIASVFGLAWSIATFLAVPVLVVEGVGPIEAVKRSTHLLKKTWGEQIAGNIGIGAAFAVVFFVGLLPFGAALALAIKLNSMPLIVGIVATFVLAALLLSLLGSALTAIYTAAVYRYATEGEPGGMFAPALVRDAFQTK
jgi:hypothetical protein